MKTDIEIAQSIELQPIVDVVKKIGLDDDDLELYGKYKAKLSFDKIREVEKNPVGKLILVTAINPTPAGEGKSTITIGLADALNTIGKKTMIAIREPSLGPVMGIKGGAAGGGYAQVLPMEDINLHFTGDMHAITTANNALSALIDNHLHQGNELGIDQRRIIWKRVVDLNDRALRHVRRSRQLRCSRAPAQSGRQAADLRVRGSRSAAQERKGRGLLCLWPGQRQRLRHQLHLCGCPRPLLQQAEGRHRAGAQAQDHRRGVHPRL